MSARAWVLFLCFSSMVASAASAMVPPAPEPSLREVHVRGAWDSERQMCRVLWITQH